MNKNYTSAHKVGGATIFEVMISVLLLTFGILALMAAQIRSVASTGEAATRTLISQAAESLSEGMMANPTQTRGTDGVLTRSYDRYIRGMTPVAGTATVNPPEALAGSLDSAGLAGFQLDNFARALNNIPDVHNIAYAICRDDAGVKPTMDTAGTMDPQCAAGGNTVYIKVAWQTGSQSNDATERVSHSFIYKAATN